MADRAVLAQRTHVRHRARRRELGVGSARPVASSAHDESRSSSSIAKHVGLRAVSLSRVWRWRSGGSSSPIALCSRFGRFPFSMAATPQKVCLNLDPTKPSLSVLPLGVCLVPEGEACAVELRQAICGPLTGLELVASEPEAVRLSSSSEISCQLGWKSIWAIVPRSQRSDLRMPRRSPPVNCEPTVAKRGKRPILIRIVSFYDITNRGF